MKCFRSAAKIAVTLVLILSLMLPMTVGAFAAAEDPAVRARSALLVEPTTGTVIYSKEPDMRVAPASTTKIMTALLAIEAIESGEIVKEEIIEVTDAAYTGVSSDAKIANVKRGENIPFIDVLYCVLNESACDACNVIAVALCGDVPTFVALMNERAKQLGCTGTSFVNTHGLSADGHYTTAEDLYLIYAEAIKHPLFLEISGVAEYKMAATNKSAKRTVVNTNKMIFGSSEYYYEYCTGGKTGHTQSAGYCMVSSAEKDGVSLVSVVMGAELVTNEDGTTDSQNLSESVRLFKWGFSNFAFRTVIDKTQLMTEVPVEMGDGAETVVLRPSVEVTAFADKSLKASDFTYDIKVPALMTGEVLMAPIQAGTVLGTVTVSYGDKVYGTAQLVANTTIDLSKVEYIEQEVKEAVSAPTVKIIAAALIVIFAAYILLVIQYNKRRKEKLAEKKREEREENGPAIKERIPITRAGETDKY